MRTWTLAGPLLAAGIGLAATGAGAEEHRQLGAHVHGQGTLNIAIEGSRISMELEAPGADIVGFEHEPSTDQQKAALEAAKKQLAAPQSLIELSATAGCVLKEAKVEIERHHHDDGDDDDDHDHAHAAGGDKDGDHADAKHDEAADHDHAHGHDHSGFHVEYAFDCKAPGSLAGISFGYFKAFAGAQKLNVTVITPKGQSQFEVSRANPRLDLGGIM